MRYIVSLLLGLATGVVIAAAMVYYNPLSTQEALSPLSVSERQQVVLGYSAVSSDAIVFTNNGETIIAPHPEKVLQLWEAPIRRSDTRVTVLHNSRNEPVGLGIKFSSQSESTRLLQGEALVNSAWHIYLPGQGSMFVEQSENYWPFLREIVIPAHWGSSDNWRGNWHGTTTAGPGVLGTGRAYGGSGRFAGLESEAIERITAKAYSAAVGPVAMEGQLTIELAAAGDDLEPESETEL